MTIYIDIVFIENLIINLIIILSTAILSKTNINWKRIIFSSSLGGAFSIVNFIFSIKPIINVLLKIIISLIMIFTAFKSLNIKKRVEQLLLFYLVSFTFGGIAFMFIFFINSQKLLLKNRTLIGIQPIKITILSGIFGYIIVILVSRINKYKFNKKSIICDLEIFFNGKNKKIKTMLDTGNLLKEPITGTNVIIVEKQSLINIVSNDILENISSIINGKWLDSKDAYSHKLMIIPFSTLGNENGLLIGFKPDYIKILKEDEEFVLTNVLIGIYDGKLSNTNSYTSLIGLDIFNKEDIQNECFENI